MKVKKNAEPALESVIAQTQIAALHSALLPVSRNCKAHSRVFWKHFEAV